MKLWFAISLLFLSLFVAGGSPASSRSEMVRVALLKGVDAVRIDGRGVLFADESGGVMHQTLPVQIKRVKEGLSINGRVVRRVVASAPVTVLVNGKGYHGSIEVSFADKGMLVVNELPLEDYLVGLINCEISSQWPLEAIKAQAVIARSYALYQKEARKSAPFHLESSVLDQVYDGCDIEDSRAARGVRETAGEVLTYNGSVIQAFYHSNCGGHTEASENVWGYDYPYLRGVECSYCLSSPSVRWEQNLSLAKIETQLTSSGYRVTGLREIRGGSRNASGRLVDLMLVTTRSSLSISAVNFRKALGYSVIKSTNFEVRTTGDQVGFSVVGYGHGVGLCQWGAKQRAADGFSYDEILSYYYPGTKLEKVYKEQ